jgi:phospholipid/cholesterol/gamma-HCH transport system substrate-binding protein
MSIFAKNQGVKISEEVKVGIFAVATLVILFFGFNFMKGKDVFSSDNTYYAVYDDVKGLQPSNPVVLNGHRIGKIYDIRLMKNDINKVVVVLSIQGGLDLPLGTKARIVDLDILGQKAVDIVLTNNIMMHESRDTLIGETSGGMVAEMLQPYIEKLNATINDFTSNLNESGTNNLKVTIANLTTAVNNVKDFSDDLKTAQVAQRLGNIMLNVQSISRELKENEENINAILANLNSVSDSLKSAQIKQTIDESYAVLKQVNDISTKINGGQGSLGLLVNDSILYNNLKSTSANLDKLVLDLKENPERYVSLSLFGGKEKKKPEK